MIAPVITRTNSSDGILNRNLTFIIKCCCCLLVGLHHFARIKVEQQGSSNPFFIILASQGGNIGVGLFFFLSGYGLMESSKIHRASFSEIIKKRFWHLFWPILLINIAYVLILYLYKYGDNNTNNFSLEIMVDFKKVDPVLWFIEVLFACYIVFYLSLSINNEVISSIVRYGLGALLIIFYGVTRSELHWHYTNIPMFFLGTAYSQYRKEIVAHFNIIFVIICLAILAIITVIGWFCIHTMWARLGVCLIVLALLLMFVNCYSLTINNKLSSKDFTYAYYLTHNKLLMLIGGGSFWGFLIISILLAILTDRTLTLFPRIFKKKELKMQ